MSLLVGPDLGAEFCKGGPSMVPTTVFELDFAISTSDQSFSLKLSPVSINSF